MSNLDFGIYFLAFDFPKAPQDFPIAPIVAEIPEIVRLLRKLAMTDCSGKRENGWLKMPEPFAPKI